jgi:hypothetical protein
MKAAGKEIEIVIILRTARKAISALHLTVKPVALIADALLDALPEATSFPTVSGRAVPDRCRAGWTRRYGIEIDPCT